MAPETANKAEVLVSVSKLVKTYAGAKRRALDSVSLEIFEGECFGLIGPNGAGKTTLMSCLLALIKPDSGSITIGGIVPGDLAVREVTGFMPERPNFEGWLTPFEFLRMHHMLALQPAVNANQDIEAVLLRVGLDKSSWTRIIRTFSRGMLQRLGLAQALIGKPKILFLDEPGSGMDPPGNVLLRQLFGQFKKEGITVILNSHHLDEMERVCDRVAFIKAGRIEAIESIEEMSAKPYILSIRSLFEFTEALRQTLEDVSEQTGCRLLSYESVYVKYLVHNAISAADVIQALVSKGIRIRAAYPEQTSLERLFELSHQSDIESGVTNV